MTIARIVAAAVLCVSCSGLVAGQTTNRPTSAKGGQISGTKGEGVVGKRITETLHQMYEAEKRKDLKFVLSHLADDFAEVAGDGGVYHRADIAAAWPDVVLKDYKLSDCAFNLMTPDAAYMSCKMDVDAAYKGQPFPQHLRVTTVWTRRQREWLARFEQATVIPAPAKTN